MHNHDLTPKHCFRCGGELALRRPKEGEPERLVCSSCDLVNYEDPKLAGCGLIVVDNRVLLGRRSIAPAKGLWVLPGGFVDRGETVPGAVEREVEEETGLTVSAERLWGLYSYPGEAVVVAVYLAKVLGGEPTAKDETAEVRLFSWEEIPWEELAFRSTRDALSEYKRERVDASG